MQRKAPKRRAIPAKIKAEIRKRQGGRCGCRQNCGARLPPDGKGLVQYQHDPALGIRPINAACTDWIPPQHDPAHIYAELTACHRRETYQGKCGAAVIGSDRYEIDKMRRHEKPPKPKRKWSNRSAFPPKGSRSLRLREKGFVDVSGSTVSITDDGAAALPADYEPLPTGTDLQEYWLGRLPEGEKRILQELINAYPKSVQRTDLDAATGYQRLSRDAYLQRMKAKRLWEKDGASVRASEVLFG